MRKTVETCEYCRFYHAKYESRAIKGLCRKRPPHPSLGWPGVMAEDWCGEFKPKKDEKIDDDKGS